MKLTESTRVITKSELLNKVIKSAVDDAEDDETEKVDLQYDIEEIDELRSSKVQKFVALNSSEYIPLNDYLNHYHIDFDKDGKEIGTSFDTPVGSWYII